MHAYGLEKIKTFDQLLLWLRDNLNWPIDEIEIEKEPFGDLTFEYDPAKDLGLKAKDVAHFREINQLRPFVSNQPWGIFFISFEDKKIPVGVLKRVLGGLTLKKRQSANKSHQKGWNLHDLLFISAHGESGERELSFLHFAEENEGKNKIILKELGWDQNDTDLKLAYVANTLRDHLVWPEEEKDTGSWRENWAGAFTSKHGAAISTAKDLTKRLGVLATKIRESVNEVLAAESDDGPLTQICENFKQTLFHNLDHDGFADMYAQTICYGLLVARIMRRSGGLVADDAALIAPVTQPFLKDLMETFLAVGGRKNKIDFNELGIDEVVDALHHSDMEAVLRDFGNKNPHDDPILHFYEHFLKEYDSIMREQRGVYYTPVPVVRFIVRSVDEILQKEFGLTDGLADTTTWGEMIKRNPDMTLPKDAKESDPFIQILDPAIGTGTFLVEVIDLIEKRMKGNWEKAGKTKKEIDVLWSKYVPANLIPRLNGFELMMAPYAITHIKIGMKLAETGYQPKNNSAPRVRIYLTNTLEEPTGASSQSEMSFITESLALEAKGADGIKAQTPITVVIGNPPYSGISSNMKGWIAKQKIEDYKYIDGIHFNERKHWLNDDYVQFIRLGEHYIEKNSAGILAYITNHGYLDNPTFRGMRWHLLNTFDDISLLDLHGNAKNKEVSPEGKPDKNVFDIQQGVAIIEAVKRPKKGKKKPLAKLRHAELWGERKNKFKILGNESHNTVPYNELDSRQPFYFFIPKNYELIDEYSFGFSVKDAFRVKSVGVVTARDKFCIDIDRKQLGNRIRDFCNSDVSNHEIQKLYNLKDTSTFILKKSRDELFKGYKDSDYKVISYRPFDNRHIFFHNKIVERPLRKVMQHFLAGKNIGLVVARQCTTDWRYAFITSNPAEFNLIGTAGRYGSGYLFPLWLYHDDHFKEKTLNFNQNFYDQVKKIFADVTPESLFDFIYAVLYSASYRKRYADFLKSDFPRIPYPKNSKIFHKVAECGTILRGLHLMESDKLDNLITTYPKDGDHEIRKCEYKDGKVWISETHYFGQVPRTAWDFYIGSYQPAQKWLKDRVPKKGQLGRILTKEDIDHYQKIIVAISETIRIMAEIDEVIEEHGGWPGAFVTV
jgi:predicted helicase